MRSSPGARALPAAILDVDLLAKESDLGICLFELGLEPATASRSATGMGDNVVDFAGVLQTPAGEA
jgi:hypothetical protein